MFLCLCSTFHIRFGSHVDCVYVLRTCLWLVRPSPSSDPPHRTTPHHKTQQTQLHQVNRVEQLWACTKGTRSALAVQQLSKSTSIALLIHTAMCVNVGSIRSIEPLTTPPHPKSNHTHSDSHDGDQHAALLQAPARREELKQQAGASGKASTPLSSQHPLL